MPFTQEDHQKNSRKVLVTGGAGFIGSTICSHLIDQNFIPIILDNLTTGVYKFTDGHFFYQGNINDKKVLDTIWREHPDIYAVVHCAAKTIVPESVSYPDLYYLNNVMQSFDLFEYILSKGCSRVLFSSSASIYGQSVLQVTENTPFNPGSPYARTKMIIELMLQDFSNAYSQFKAISLRYFNPIGADPNLRTGMQVKNPSHVLGKLMECHHNNTPFYVTGTHWPTRDGSGIRDYIHIWDLARAHVLALQNFDHVTQLQNYQVYNLGTGTGTTVLELVAAFIEVIGKNIHIQYSDAREGDIAGSYAICTKAEKELKWKTELTIKEGIADSLRWLQKRKALLGY